MADKYIVVIQSGQYPAETSDGTEILESMGHCAYFNTIEEAFDDAIEFRRSMFEKFDIGTRYEFIGPAADGLTFASWIVGTAAGATAPEKLQEDGAECDE